MQPIIWGTAGHIDHGKTALIEALTGTNTDRLQEEQDRGVTIDIGFAFLTDEISFIDVPGHEKFVKNMVTGVSTIDAALVVIAADDGVMPQTREHVEILELLDVQSGIIAMTKTDIAEPEWIDLVEESIGEFVAGTVLEDAQIIRTSAEKREGIEQLRDAILDISTKLPRRLDRGIPRLPIDRVFSVKGFGTVVTGSVLSGKFQTDDTVEILPSRQKSKIRGIQTHGHSVKTAGMSERAALNLGGVETGDLERGFQVTSPGFLTVTNTLYTSCRILSGSEHPLEQNQRVRVHLGTTEILARCSIIDGQEIKQGDEGFVKLRLEDQTVATSGDKFILRFYSPMRTIGGGTVLILEDRLEKNRNGLIDLLNGLDTSDLPEMIVGQLKLRHPALLSVDELSRRLFYADALLEPSIADLKNASAISAYEIDGTIKFGIRDLLEDEKFRLKERIGTYQQKHPKEPGIQKSQLEQETGLPEETFRALITKIIETGDIVEEGPILRTPDHEIRLSSSEMEFKERLENYIRAQGFQPPAIHDLEDELDISGNELRQFLKILLYEKAVERLPGDLYFHVKQTEQLRAELEEFFQSNETLTVSEFKDITGSSRKYTIPLLEYADQRGWTMRDGEVRRKQNL
ncbi:MAG: Selenocysteine-specific elongation factor [Candidatus Marinimicrobia bacterium]|nr:Selenocysteine-specific elongation factor [Candidatus Neomarinimicrobiota bacterium]